MESGPTRGASDDANEWHASPLLAFGVRALVYLVPVLFAYIVIRAVGSWLFRPAGWLGLAAWIVQAAAIGAIVSRGIARVTQRLLPLATLLTTSLIFPDRAPSRFGVALRSGTVKQMRKRADELTRDGLGTTPAEAAESAIVLVSGLGRHDRLTRGHTERVRAYADLIAAEMHLSDEDRNWLAWGVLLHDVGKMTVPPEILNKVEKLTDEEWGILKNHPAAGEEMLQPLVPWLGKWVKAAGEHHERWDGRGYPRGLEASEISLAGRITAVADAYDVITSKRSYKEPMSAEAARRELVACAGSQFDPEVVRSFLRVSIGHRPDAGPLAWVTELPMVRGVVGVTASPVVSALGAAVIAGSALLGMGDDAAARRTAFAAEIESRTTLPVTDVRNVESSTDAITDRPSTADLQSVDDPLVTTSTDDRGSLPPAESTVPDPDPEPGEVGPSTTTGTTATGTIATGSGVTTTTPPGPLSTTTVTPATVPLVTGPPTTAVSTTSPATTSVPSVTVPVTTSVTIPSVTVPSVTVPSVTVPSVTVPSVTVPGITTPPVTTPEITTPVVTTPVVTTPAVTTPTIPLPTNPLLPGGLLGP